MVNFQRHDLFALKTSEYLHDDGDAGDDNGKGNLSLLRIYAHACGYTTGVGHLFVGFRHFSKKLQNYEMQRGALV